MIFNYILMYLIQYDVSISYTCKTCTLCYLSSWQLKIFWTIDFTCVCKWMNGITLLIAGKIALYYELTLKTTHCEKAKSNPTNRICQFFISQYWDFLRLHTSQVPKSCLQIELGIWGMLIVLYMEKNVLLKTLCFSNS